MARQLIFGNLKLGEVGGMMGGVREGMVLARVGDLTNERGEFDAEWVMGKLRKGGVRACRTRVEKIMTAVTVAVRKLWGGSWEQSVEEMDSIDFVWGGQ